MSEEMTDKQIRPPYKEVLMHDHILRLEEELKRKEQECEELKDKLNCCFCNPHVELNDIEKLRKCLEVTECFSRQLDQLKAENEELKAENNTYKSSIVANLDKNISKRYRELLEENDQLKAENDLFRTCHDNEQAKRRKYEQTLTEIKEIAEANKKYIYVLPNYSVAGDSLEFSFEFTKQILQKINEVEDDLV